MEIFEAQSSAGKIGLKDTKGKVIELEISVFDYPMWQEYQKLTASAERLKNMPTTSDEDKAKVASEEMKSLLAQLKMLLPDIKAEMLRGYPLTKLAGILEHCVKLASSAMSEERTEEQKKSIQVAFKNIALTRQGVTFSTIKTGNLSIQEFEDYYTASEIWRKMDLLDIYEATALSHPVDKKNVQKVQRRLDSIQNEINIKLYGKTQSKGKDFWDMMRKGKLDNV